MESEVIVPLETLPSDNVTEPVPRLIVFLPRSSAVPLLIVKSLPVGRPANVSVEPPSSASSSSVTLSHKAAGTPNDPSPSRNEFLHPIRVGEAVSVSASSRGQFSTHFTRSSVAAQLASKAQTLWSRRNSGITDCMFSAGLLTLIPIGVLSSGPKRSLTQLIPLSGNVRPDHRPAGFAFARRPRSGPTGWDCRSAREAAIGSNATMARSAFVMRSMYFTMNVR